MDIHFYIYSLIAQPWISASVLGLLTSTTLWWSQTLANWEACVRISIQQEALGLGVVYCQQFRLKLVWQPEWDDMPAAVLTPQHQNPVFLVPADPGCPGLGAVK